MSFTRTLLNKGIISQARKGYNHVQPAESSLQIENLSNTFFCRTDSWLVSKLATWLYRYAPHNDVPVNDGSNIRRWAHYIIIL